MEQTFKWFQLNSIVKGEVSSFEDRLGDHFKR